MQFFSRIMIVALSDIKSWFVVPPLKLTALRNFKALDIIRLHAHVAEI